ncbi:MAG TPA: polysaccharide deacetylase family protein [Anaerolineae bacterium]
MMILRWDKWGAQVLIHSGLLAGIERSEARQENVLRILAYHRIGDPADDRQRGDPSLFSVSAEGFSAQMAYLAEHYHAISPTEMLAALGGSHRLPPRSVLITFDDAYHDFLDLAWPVLQRLQLPAVLFVATDYVGGSQIYWWDRLHQALARTECCELRLPDGSYWQLSGEAARHRALKAIGRRLKHMEHGAAMALIGQIVDRLAVKIDSSGLILNWDEVRQMRDGGLYVGAHTASHPILSRVSTEQARREIVQSQQAVQEELGQSWPIFCYPVGHPPDLRADLVTVLREEGFQAAVTMIEGHNIVGQSEPLRLRRVAVAPHITLDEFRLILTRAYDLYGAVAQVGPRDWK